MKQILKKILIFSTLLFAMSECDAARWGAEFQKEVAASLQEIEDNIGAVTTLAGLITLIEDNTDDKKEASVDWNIRVFKKLKEQWLRVDEKIAAKVSDLIQDGTITDINQLDPVDAAYRDLTDTIIAPRSTNVYSPDGYQLWSDTDIDYDIKNAVPKTPKTNKEKAKDKLDAAEKRLDAKETDYKTHVVNAVRTGFQNATDRWDEANGIWASKGAGDDFTTMEDKILLMDDELKAANTAFAAFEADKKAAQAAILAAQGRLDGVAPTVKLIKPEYDDQATKALDDAKAKQTAGLTSPTGFDMTGITADIATMDAKIAAAKLKVPATGGPGGGGGPKLPDPKTANLKDAAARQAILDAIDASDKATLTPWLTDMAAKAKAEHNALNAKNADFRTFIENMVAKLKTKGFKPADKNADFKTLTSIDSIQGGVAYKKLT